MPKTAAFLGASLLMAATGEINDQGLRGDVVVMIWMRRVEG